MGAVRNPCLTIGQIIEGDTTKIWTTTNNLTPEKKRIVKQMIHDAESKLIEMESENLLQLIPFFADFFADSQHELGHTSVSQHQIDKGDAIDQSTKLFDKFQPDNERKYKKSYETCINMTSSDHPTPHGHPHMCWYGSRMAQCVFP